MSNKRKPPEECKSQRPGTGKLYMAAEEVASIKRLEQEYLCDVAVTRHWRHKRQIERHPEACARCEVKCAYGRRWMEMLAAEAETA